MSVLKENARLGKYLAQSLIKENEYTETYRVIDDNDNIYFLKLYILKKTPERLMDTATHEVYTIERCRYNDNTTSVLCFDEFDALVPNRSNIDNTSMSGEVNEFLSQLNNCSKKGIFVIATSNRPDKIDPAVLCTGRIDKQIYVPLPDLDARKEMFMLHLKDRPYDETAIDAQHLAELSNGYIASDIAYIVNDAAMTAAFTNQLISQELLETSIRNTRPSIRPEMVKMYKEIEEKMQGVERRNMERPRIGFNA